MGFNGVDASFGNKLAHLDSLTPKQAKAAYRMLRKYRNQLAASGVNYDELEEPVIEEPVPSVNGTRQIFLNDKGHAVFDFPYDPVLVDAVKLIPGRKWNKKSKTWSVELTHPSMDMIDRFAIQYDFRLDEEIENALQEKAETMNELLGLSAAQSSSDERVNNLTVNGELREFQKAGIDYLLRSKRSFLADDMGLGKTLQSLATVEIASAFPSIIVCPAVVKLNWISEISKWFPDRSVLRIDGRNASTDLLGSNHDFYILNWDILEAWEDRLFELKAHSVIFDESHYAKNHKAKRSKSAKIVAKDPEYIFCLSGTPILNRNHELVSQLQILGRLDIFGGYWPFVKRYCGARKIQFPGRKPFWEMNESLHTEELNRILRSNCYIRRTKNDVLKDLPPKQRTFIEIEPRHMTNYRRASSNFLNWIMEKEAENEQWLASIEDMDPDAQLEAIEERRDEVEQKVERNELLMKLVELRGIATDAKMEQCIEWIEDFMESGEKLVVFVWHRRAAENISRIFSCNAITGETSHDDRFEYARDFQENPDTKMIVCNIKAGGVGINLFAAQNALFVEQDWTPGNNDQAEDRLHRIGQEGSVNCWYIIGLDTIDVHVRNLVEQKRVTVESATDGTVAKPITLKSLIREMRGG